MVSKNRYCRHCAATTPQYPCSEAGPPPPSTLLIIQKFATQGLAVEVWLCLRCRCLSYEMWLWEKQPVDLREVLHKPPREGQ